MDVSWYDLCALSKGLAATCLTESVRPWSALAGTAPVRDHNELHTLVQVRHEGSVVAAYNSKVARPGVRVGKAMTGVARERSGAC